MLSTRYGDVPWQLPHPYGLFFDDRRFLSGLLIRLNGVVSLPLAADDSKGYIATFALANPPFETPAGRVEKNTIGIWRERRIRGAVVHEKVQIDNYGSERVVFELEVRLRCTFEDLFSVRGFVDAGQHRILSLTEQEGAQLVWLREGLDGRRRATRVSFEPPPSRLKDDRPLFEFVLESRVRFQLDFTMTPVLSDAARSPHGDIRPRPKRKASDGALVHCGFALAGNAPRRP